MGRTVVIGVGNPYRCDDGVGPAVVGLLRPNAPAGVELTSTLGDTTKLIDLWDGADLVIVVDAMRAATPRIGTIHHVTVGDLPVANDPVSSHGLQLGEAIELARVLGRLPRRLELFAVEIGEPGHGTELSPAILQSAQRLARQIAAEVMS
jgi:hydrogenase maturation protease